MNHYQKIDIHAASPEAWPATIPALDGPEACKAVRRLWRKFLGAPCPYELRITSGNRTTWKSSSPTVMRGRRVPTFNVNPEQGWRDLVHDLSHWFHRKLYPKKNPHNPLHAHLEAEMIAHVVASGWLDGALKSRPAPKVRDVVAERAARIEERIAAWEAKERRARNALKKLRPRQRYYQRKLAERETA